MLDTLGILVKIHNSNCQPFLRIVGALFFLCAAGCHTTTHHSPNSNTGSAITSSTPQSQSNSIQPTYLSATTDQKELYDAKPRPLAHLVPSRTRQNAKTSDNADTIIAAVKQSSDHTSRITRVLEPSIRWGRMVHIVKPGETLYNISLTYYGSDSYWKNIFNENRSRLTSPSALTIGERLYLPVNPNAQEGSSMVIVPRSRPDFYIVSPNDTLFKIADLFLGDGNQWQTIFQANRHQLKTPDDIQAGLSLVIP